MFPPEGTAIQGAVSARVVRRGPAGERTSERQLHITLPEDTFSKREPLALMIAGPFADAFGIQLWFLIAGISCTLMGILGFLSSDVMTMENRSKEMTQNVLSEPS